MSEREDDTPETASTRHRQTTPSGSYYYDDATNYEPYNPEEEEDAPDDDEARETPQAGSASADPTTPHTSRRACAGLLRYNRRSQQAWAAPI